MNYLGALRVKLCFLLSSLLLGCAAVPGTHKEGYYIVMNGNENNRMCCTPEGFSPATKAIDQHDEIAARVILFHTNPEWRSIGSTQSNGGLKYYAYSSHLYQGDTDWRMAKLWQEFNREFGYARIPWLDEMVAKQNATAEHYWKSSQEELNSLSSLPTAFGNTPAPSRPQSGSGGQYTSGDPCGGAGMLPDGRCEGSATRRWK